VQSALPGGCVALLQWEMFAGIPAPTWAGTPAASASFKFLRDSRPCGTCSTIQVGPAQPRPCVRGYASSSSRMPYGLRSWLRVCMYSESRGLSCKVSFELVHMLKKLRIRGVHVSPR